jgi:hypothetical protein
MNYNQSPEDRTALYEIWWVLKGEHQQGVNKRNLCLFLLAVMGVSW